MVGDPATTSLVTVAFDFPTREDVDAFVTEAEAARGTQLRVAIEALDRWGTGS